MDKRTVRMGMSMGVGMTSTDQERTRMFQIIAPGAERSSAMSALRSLRRNEPSEKRAVLLI